MGIIVLKFIELGKNKFSFSISYVLDENDYNRAIPFSNYFFYKNRLVLIKDSEKFWKKDNNNLLVENLCYKVYNDSIYTSNKQWLCQDCTVSRDYYYVGILNFKNNKLTLKLYPDGIIPNKYIIEYF